MPLASTPELSMPAPRPKQGNRQLWGKRGPIPEAAQTRFGELVEKAARPIDDVRGTARYRHHALGVLGRRTLTWAWEAYRCA